jgi:Putative O-methyltransferase
MAGYSFEKFNYGLRPSKQVERKILIEKLLRLSQIGFDLRKYTYVGFGSVYYVDFVMFHKFLYLRDMICVERAEHQRRMKFNKPYKCVKLKLSEFAVVVDSLSKRRPYLVWLDYDYPVSRSMLADIDSCVNRLAPGSIFLVTAEARARLTDDDAPGIEVQSLADQSTYLVGVYNDAFSDLIGRDVTVPDLDKNVIPGVFWEAITGRIRETLLNRRGVEYSQIFNYLYADGAPMITVGGVIGGPEHMQRLQDKNFYNEPHVTNGAEPIVVSVPPLTMREKHWLDSRIDDNLTVDKLAFELEQEFFENYRRYYKEYPTFVEALM